MANNEHRRLRNRSWILFAAAFAFGACSAGESKAPPAAENVLPSTSSCDGGSCQPNRCDDQLVDLATDARHCGRCGHACGDGLCKAGECECEPGYSVCDDGCRALATDSTNCGACGATCEADESCTNGSCMCIKTMCGDRCVDTKTNPSNCGACGVTCEGGCDNGKCLPLALAIDQPHANLIRADGSGVYWITYKGVGHCPLGGCLNRKAEVLVDDSVVDGVMTSLFVDATHVYWGTSHTHLGGPQGDGRGVIQRCAKTATCVAETVAVTGDVANLVVDDANVYWIDQATSTDTKLLACPKEGCGSSPPSVLLSSATISAPIMRDLVLAPGSLIFGIQQASDGATVIKTCPRPAGCPGGMPVALASPEVKGHSLLSDGTNLFFMSGTRNLTPHGCPLADCSAPRAYPINPVAFNFGLILAAGGGHVYYTEPSEIDGDLAVADIVLQRCTVESCAAPTLHGNALVRSWTYFADHLYWSNPFGTLYRFKP